MQNYTITHEKSSDDRVIALYESLAKIHGFMDTIVNDLDAGILELKASAEKYASITSLIECASSKAKIERLEQELRTAELVCACLTQLAEGAASAGAVVVGDFVAVANIVSSLSKILQNIQNYRINKAKHEAQKIENLDELKNVMIDVYYKHQGMCMALTRAIESLTDQHMLAEIRYGLAKEILKDEHKEHFDKQRQLLKSKLEICQKLITTTLTEAWFIKFKNSLEIDKNAIVKVEQQDIGTISENFAKYGKLMGISVDTLMFLYVQLRTVKKCKSLDSQLSREEMDAVLEEFNKLLKQLADSTTLQSVSAPFKCLSFLIHLADKLQQYNVDSQFIVTVAALLGVNVIGDLINVYYKSFPTEYLTVQKGLLGDVKKLIKQSHKTSKLLFTKVTLSTETEQKIAVCSLLAFYLFARLLNQISSKNQERQYNDRYLKNLSHWAIELAFLDSVSSDESKDIINRLDACKRYLLQNFRNFCILHSDCGVSDWSKGSIICAELEDAGSQIHKVLQQIQKTVGQPAEVPVIDIDSFIEQWQVLWMQEHQAEIIATLGSAYTQTNPLSIRWISCQASLKDTPHGINVKIKKVETSASAVSGQYKQSLGIVTADNYLSYTNLQKNNELYQLHSSHRFNPTIRFSIQGVTQTSVEINNKKHLCSFAADDTGIIIEQGSLLFNEKKLPKKTPFIVEQPVASYKQEYLVQLSGTVSIMFNQKVRLPEAYADKAVGDTQIEWHIPIKQIFKDLKKYRQQHQLLNVDDAALQKLNLIEVSDESVDVKVSSTLQQAAEKVNFVTLSPAVINIKIKAILDTVKENYYNEHKVFRMPSLLGTPLSINEYQPLMAQSVEKYQEPKSTKLTLDAFLRWFTSANQQNNCTAFLMGDAGCGKTTFLNYVMHEWSKHESNLSNRYRWIFVLDGAHFNSQRYSKEQLESPHGLISIIIDECLMSAIKNTVAQHPNMTVGLCKTILFEHLLSCITKESANDRNILIIVDAIDEHERNNHITAFVNQLLVRYQQLAVKPTPHFDLILTARTYITATDDNYFSLGELPCMQLLGFSDDDLQNYVQKRFEHVQFNKYYEQQKSRLIELLLVNTAFKLMCKTPLILNLVCSLWMEPEAEQYADYKEKDYLIRLLNLTCLRYLKKFRREINCAPLQPKEIDDYCRAQIQFLEHYALVRLLAEKDSAKIAHNAMASIKYIDQLTPKGCGLPYMSSKLNVNDLIADSLEQPAGKSLQKLISGDSGLEAAGIADALAPEKIDEFDKAIKQNHSINDTQKMLSSKELHSITSITGHIQIKKNTIEEQLQFGYLQLPLGTGSVEWVLIERNYEFQHLVFRNYFIASLLVDCLRKKYNTRNDIAHDFQTAINCINVSSKTHQISTNLELFIKLYVIQQPKETHILNLMRELLQDAKTDLPIIQEIDKWIKEDKGYAQVQLLTKQSALSALIKNIIGKKFDLKIKNGQASNKTTLILEGGYHEHDDPQASLRIKLMLDTLCIQFSGWLKDAALNNCFEIQYDRKEDGIQCRIYCIRLQYAKEDKKMLSLILEEMMVQLAAERPKLLLEPYESGIIQLFQSFLKGDYHCDFHLDEEQKKLQCKLVAKAKKSHDIENLVFCLNDLRTEFASFISKNNLNLTIFSDDNVDPFFTISIDNKENQELLLLLRDMEEKINTQSLDKDFVRETVAPAKKKIGQNEKVVPSSSKKSIVTDGTKAQVDKKNTDKKPERNQKTTTKHGYQDRSNRGIDALMPKTGTTLASKTQKHRNVHEITTPTNPVNDGSIEIISCTTHPNDDFESMRDKGIVDIAVKRDMVAKGEQVQTTSAGAAQKSALSVDSSGKSSQKPISEGYGSKNLGEVARFFKSETSLSNDASATRITEPKPSPSSGDLQSKSYD